MTTWSSQGVNPVVGSPLTLRQNVAATAVGVSGISQFLIDSRKWNMMWVTVEDNDIRYTLDGTSPTATTGHVLPADGAPLKITGKLRIFEFRMIAVSGTAVVTISLDDYARAGGVN